jgi:hypothetical protein
VYFFAVCCCKAGKSIFAFSWDILDVQISKDNVNAYCSCTDICFVENLLPWVINHVYVSIPSFQNLHCHPCSRTFLFQVSQQFAACILLPDNTKASLSAVSVLPKAKFVSVEPISKQE